MEHCLGLIVDRVAGCDMMQTMRPRYFPQPPIAFLPGRRFEVAEGLKAGDNVAAALKGELHDGDVVKESTDSSTPTTQ